MTDEPRLRHAESDKDAGLLRDFYRDVFPEEPVGVLAETFFHHLPHMERHHWFMLEEPSGDVAAAFALIPWEWEIGGVRLRVAEQGIVGTREDLRGRGLMRRLNAEFDRALEEGGYDLSVIQGIPGFYHHFGYHYALPLNNHLNVGLHMVPEAVPDGWAFRFATEADIPWFLAEDEKYRRANLVSVVRDEAVWRYLLGESRKTEYGGAFVIVEGPGEKFYCRMPGMGFGAGLIISEVSAGISHAAFAALLSHARGLAVEQGKPYIRLDVHNDSTAGRAARAMGAAPGRPYAWQVKVPEIPGLLEKMAPLFGQRLENSRFARYSGRFRLDFYQHAVDLVLDSGAVAAVETDAEEEPDAVLCVPSDLFAALALGHRTWRDLQANRPDISPAMQHVGPQVGLAADPTELLADTLFPRATSWVYERY
ncbi:MAG: GNAT family N-acetyltransferase [Desulfatibacillaceae bacterium]